MNLLGRFLLVSVACVAIAAACEQQIVVVDRDGGGGGDGDADDGGSAEYVASSSVGTTVSTTTGFGGGCPDAAPPVEPLTACDSITSTVGATGGPTLCTTCVSDGAGNQYTTQCSDQSCECYIGDTLCFTCEGAGPYACSVSCCLYPWNFLDAG